MKNPEQRVRSQRGVSLIEAVVAMAIMGFGMLGVLGMQSALRGNADVSKQRSEAVRIAQATIEARRSFSVLGVTAGANAYDSIVSTASPDITPVDSNATFSLVSTVTDFPAVADALVAAPHKRIVVTVTWPDRNNQPQTVSMGTIVSATAPEVAAALATPGDASPVQSTGGRHPTVPPLAVDLGNGTSRFTPPNAPTGVSWTFNNVNGFITHTCLLTVCTPFQGRLLAGFVNFAAGTPGSRAPRPTSADSESPLGPALVNAAFDNVTVRVPITSPSVQTITCFHQMESTYVAYFCAMPVTLVAPQHWSGQALVDLPSGLDLVDSISDRDEDEYRVCRYTTVQSQAVVPAIRNEDHPLHYSDVRTSLIGQNFLVIRAGNDTLTPRLFDCPGDNGSTDINGTTWHHQPSS